MVLDRVCGGALHLQTAGDAGSWAVARLRAVSESGSTMKSSYRILSLIFFMCAVLIAAVVPDVPKISPEDKLAIRNSQLEVLQTAQALQQTPQYKAWDDARARQSTLLNGLDQKYKATENKLVLCDGPGLGACEKVGKGDLEFMPIPPEKPAEKKN